MTADLVIYLVALAVLAVVRFGLWRWLARRLKRNGGSNARRPA